MTADRAAWALACLGLLASGCSVGLDFSPGALLPPLDAGVGASDAPSADAPSADAPSADAPSADAPSDCTTGACRGANCRASQVACGTQCVDLASDERHCGACDRGCVMGAQRCCRGVCVARCE